MLLRAVRVTRWAAWSRPALRGCSLLGVWLALVLTTVPMLDPTPAQGRAIAVLTGTVAALAVVSAALPWSRWPAPAVLAYPAVAVLATAVLAHLDASAGPAYSAVPALCFLWVGLCAPRGASLLLLPVAVPAWLAVVGGWDRVVEVRLVVTASLWLLVAEVTAAILARQATVADELRRAASTDALTSLGNRAGLDARVAAMAAGDVVVLLDLDHFKTLNDTLGHAAGDRVLADFGAVLQADLRGGDHACRYGGEEFLLLLPRCTVQQAVEVTARLRRRWAATHPGTTFSAGVAGHRGDRSGAATLAAADAALYLAKDAGRDCDRVEGDPAPVAAVAPHAAPVGSGAVVDLGRGVVELPEPPSERVELPDHLVLPAQPVAPRVPAQRLPRSPHPYTPDPYPPNPYRAATGSGGGSAGSAAVPAQRGRHRVADRG